MCLDTMMVSLAPSWLIHYRIGISDFLFDYKLYVMKIVCTRRFECKFITVFFVWNVCVFRIAWGLNTYIVSRKDITIKYVLRMTL
jgi:hypothetical protein